MSPLERYEQVLARPGFMRDPAQRSVVALLDTLYRAISEEPTRSRRRWSLGRKNKDRSMPGGLYLWGPVGRGKTLLIDLFYECLPPTIRRRQHFHGFMREVHNELKQLRHVQDPLREIAKKWADRLAVLCLDEFHVIDITDAMLLAGLLETLFDRGVVLVTTSNEPPDDLYRGGLQRERFLPAIELLKRRLVVHELAGAADYRLRTLEQAIVYHTPDDERSRAALGGQFEALTRQPPLATTVDLDGRPLPVLGSANGVVWCEFDALCGGPRGTLDYIELGRCFHTVLLSGVPVMGEEQNDAARRFINLLDELYDRNVNLLLSAAAPPAELYRGRRLAAVFSRTISRLTEMRSYEYLARPHQSD